MTKVVDTPNPVPPSETSSQSKTVANAKVDAKVITATPADGPCEEALKSLFSSDAVEGNNGVPEDSEEIVIIDGEKNLVSEEASALPLQTTDGAPLTPINALARLGDTDNISKAELVNVLESFVGLVKGGMLPVSAANNMDFSVSTPGPEKISAVSVDDKTAVIEELRGLLLEAQETIIRLLNDRVDDRANLARLETELKLLPDLQNQADRAIAVAINTDDFRSDLTKVKFELERLRLAKVREEVGNKKGFWTGVRGWFFNKGT